MDMKDGGPQVPRLGTTASPCLPLLFNLKSEKATVEIFYCKKKEFMFSLCLCSKDFVLCSRSINKKVSFLGGYILTMCGIKKVCVFLPAEA